MNGQDFFDTLLGHVYQYQKEGVVVISGDFNDRIGDSADYIEGVDEVPPRDVVDYRAADQHGELLLEFLTSTECCVLNGRNQIGNDFTSVSTRGAAVVDYCIVLHGQLHLFQEFNVKRDRTLFDEAGCLVRRDAAGGVISDHSVLLWQLEIARQGDQIQRHDHGPPVTVTKYNLSDIPQGFLEQGYMRQVDVLLGRLQTEEASQINIDSVYDQFCDVVHAEMANKLQSKIVTLNSSRLKSHGGLSL